jgi:hypothetical protein
MNTNKLLITLCGTLLASLSALGQGTLIYDQQTATNLAPGNGDGGLLITETQPMGQSFTPGLGSISFVQLKFADSHLGNGVGARVYLNLLANSITGSVIGATSPVSMPDRFFWGVTNFYFASPVSLNPGTTYYLQPVALPGSDREWDVIVNSYNYSGGTGYAYGMAQPYQFWFREGIIIPEPSPAFLVTAGLGAISLAIQRRRRSKSRS